jgi:hypothetical protein
LTLTKDWDKCAAHAEGWLTKALSHGTHAGGVGTYAKGQYSFTHGHNLDTDVPDSFLIGRYGKLIRDNPDNPDDSKTLFAIANGDWSADGSKNSIGFRVFKDGHAEVQTQGTTNNSVVIKQTLDNAVEDIKLTIRETSTYTERFVVGITETIISEDNISNPQVPLLSNQNYTAEIGDIIFAGYKSEYDYNDDNILDYSDVKYLNKVLDECISPPRYKTFDINDDGVRDSKDILALKQYLDTKTGFFVWNGEKWEKYTDLAYSPYSWNPPSSVAISGVIATLDAEILLLSNKIKQLESEIAELKK